MSNLFNELSELNFSSSVRAAKYDYDAANVSKKEQRSFRVKVRNLNNNVYFSENVTEAQAKQFASFSEKILLACTKNKKSFSQLAVSEVYQNFEKLSEADKQTVKAMHAKIVAFVAPVAADTVDSKKKK